MRGAVVLGRAGCIAVGRVGGEVGGWEDEAMGRMGLRGEDSTASEGWMRRSWSTSVSTSSSAGFGLRLSGTW